MESTGDHHEAPDHSDISEDEMAYFVEEESASVFVAKYCRQCGEGLVEGVCYTCTTVSVSKNAKPVEKDHSESFVKDSIGLYALILGSMILFQIFESTVVADFVVCSIDAVLVLIWTGCRWRTMKPLLFSRFNPAWLLGGALMGCVSWAVVNGYFYLLGMLTDFPIITYSEEFFAEGYGIEWVILLICVQPGIIEELAFRGIIFNALRKLLSVRETVIISSVMFAIIHLSLFSLPTLFLMGVMFAWLRLKTGVLWVPMVCHFTHNFLCIVQEVYL